MRPGTTQRRRRRAAGHRPAPASSGPQDRPRRGRRRRAGGASAIHSPVTTSRRCAARIRVRSAIGQRTGRGVRRVRRATMRGHDDADLAPVHRRRRCRPPPRRRTAWPCSSGSRSTSRSRSRRPSAARPSSSSGIGHLDAARIAAMDPDALDDGLPDAAGPAPLPGRDGRQGPGALPGHRRRLRQRRRAASGPRPTDGKDLERACSALPGFGEMKAAAAPRDRRRSASA